MDKRTYRSFFLKRKNIAKLRAIIRQTNCSHQYHWQSQLRKLAACKVLDMNRHEAKIYRLPP
jgi:hypothetical protein